jgi:hypothetical protein
LRKASAYFRGQSRTPTPVLELPKSVERAYVLAKDAGHRGPVIGGYLTKGFDENLVASTVTPSGLTVVASDSGQVLSQLRPDDGDAFTASCLVKLRTAENDEDRLCGIVIGTQSGSIILLELSSSVRVIATCKANTVAITALAVVDKSIIVAGTESGQVLVYDPIHHPETPSVAISVFQADASARAVTAIASVISGTETHVWTAFDQYGIVLLRLITDPAGVSTLDRISKDPITVDGMQSVTDFAVSIAHNIMICLSSCNDVFLIDLTTSELVQRYPASLMTCGSALSTLGAAEVTSSPGSTFLFLAGIDGSLSIRELTRREKDKKLQCMLHGCIDRLSPLDKNLPVEYPDPIGGCPITSVSISESKDVCVVGDASCSLYVVPLQLKSLSRASSVTASEPDEDVDSLTEPRRSIDEYEQQDGVQEVVPEKFKDEDEKQPNHVPEQSIREADSEESKK